MPQEQISVARYRFDGKSTRAGRARARTLAVEQARMAGSPVGRPKSRHSGCRGGCQLSPDCVPQFRVIRSQAFSPDREPPVAPRGTNPARLPPTRPPWRRRPGWSEALGEGSDAFTPLRPTTRTLAPGRPPGPRTGPAPSRKTARVSGPGGLSGGSSCIET